MNSAILSWILILFSTSPLWAWDSQTHSLIARLSLQDDPALQQMEPVPAESLEHFLATTEYKTVPAFIQALHLNPKTVFPFRLKEETPKIKIPLIDIFETYVNEPDWGMDREICRTYTGFCNKNLQNIGAFQLGITSQAFRHMYWPEGYLKLLSKFLPLPKHVRHPLGEAPDRSQLFFDLSVRASLTGHPYWAARFLAWSMHYSQDVSQPFHAAQLPSKILEYKEGLLPSFKLTVRKLSYYHFAFEGYIDLILTGNANLGNAGDKIQKSLEQAISAAHDLSQTSARNVTKAVAAKSVDHAGKESFTERTAEAAIAFFPKFPPQEKDLEAYMKNPAFKDAVLKNAQPGPLLDEFTSIAESCLAEGGSGTISLLHLFQKAVASQASQLHPSVPISQIRLPDASAVSFN